MAIELTMDETGMQEAFRGAVLAQLTVEAKERLIAGAIGHLLKETKGSGCNGRLYETYPSPLQNALNNAVTQLANDMMREEVATNPAFRDAVRMHLGKAVEKLMEDEYDMSQAIGEAIRRTLDKRDY